MNDSRVRVVIVHPSDPTTGRIGGIETVLADFISHAPGDFEVEYVGVTSGPSPRPVGHWGHVRVGERTIRFLPVLRIRDPHRRGRVPLALRFAIAVALRRRTVKTQGRVLQFHRPALALPFLWDRAAKLQVVHLTAASDISARQSESRWRHLPWLFRLTERVTLSRMQLVLCDSPDVAADLRARYPRLSSKIGHLPTWADTDVFSPPDASEREALRQQLEREVDLPATGSLLVFAGRLEGIKDPILLVDAFAEVARDFDNARLAVVGDGALRPRIAGRISDYGLNHRAHLLGRLPRQRLVDVMRAADVFVLSSASEAMPLAVLEALASGVPVVSTAVGAVPSIVSHGVDGWIAADRSPVSLAQGIQWALAQDREVMSSRAVEAAAPYSARDVLRRFYDAHRELATRPPIASATQGRQV